MRKVVSKLAGMMLLVVGVSSIASAAVPEIDPASGANALALLAGALLVIRGHRRS